MRVIDRFMARICVGLCFLLLFFTQSGARAPVCDALSRLSNGTVTYEAFGEILHTQGTTTNTHLYAGQQFAPELGLYYNRARFLSANHGRFWSQDPFEGFASDPQSLHKYLYAHGAPVNGIDPSGYSRLWEKTMTLALMTRLYTANAIIRIGATRVLGVRVAQILAKTLLTVEFFSFLSNPHQYVAEYRSIGVPPGTRRLVTGSGQVLASGMRAARRGLGGLWRGGARTPPTSLAAKSGLSIASSGSPAIGNASLALTSRQAALLDQFSGVGSSTLVHKSAVSLSDLSALTAKTGREFGMFSLGGRRMVYGGSATNLGLSELQIYAKALGGWRFSGHTHPGTSSSVLGASGGDRNVLRLFQEMGTQNRSVILNSSGQFRTFTPSVFDDAFGF